MLYSVFIQSPNEDSMSSELNVDKHISQLVAAVNDAAIPCPLHVTIEFLETLVGFI